MASSDVDLGLLQYSVRYAGCWSVFSAVWGWQTPNHVTLKNRSPALLTLPAPELFEIHARFANALSWMAVSEQMKHGWPAADGEYLEVHLSHLVGLTFKRVCDLVQRSRATHFEARLASDTSIC